LHIQNIYKLVYLEGMSTNFLSRLSESEELDDNMIVLRTGDNEYIDIPIDIYDQISELVVYTEDNNNNQEYTLWFSTEDCNIVIKYFSGIKNSLKKMDSLRLERLFSSRKDVACFTIKKGSNFNTDSCQQLSIDAGITMMDNQLITSTNAVQIAAGCISKINSANNIYKKNRDAKLCKLNKLLEYSISFIIEHKNTNGILWHLAEEQFTNDVMPYIKIRDTNVYNEIGTNIIGKTHKN
jgi:hypothetical protein